MKTEIVRWYRALLRYRINRKNRSRLLNKDVSIISSNCVGGVISHELGLRFNSPTVNLFFKPDDFLKFISDLPKYCEAELIENKEHKKLYPVGQLDDINVYFLHFVSFDDAKEKWDKRKKRINYDKLFFIMLQRDGCTYENIQQFDSLDYKNKVIFTSKSMPEIKSAFHINGSALNGEVNDLCGYKSKLSGKRWIDDFDYVTFINNGIR